MNDKIIKLEKYSDLLYDELGEAIELIIGLHQYRGYIGDDLIKALENEIDRLLTWFENNSVIVTRTVTEVVMRETEELEWIE